MFVLKFLLSAHDISESMRKSMVYLAVVASLVVIALALSLHAATAIKAARPRQEGAGRLVSALGLTDLCLFTEARYTRHPSMADRNTAFQDYPFSFEHFPSGSLIPVPEVVRK